MGDDSIEKKVYHQVLLKWQMILLGLELLGLDEDWHNPDGNIGCSWLYYASQELINIHEQGTTERILKHGTGHGSASGSSSGKREPWVTTSPPTDGVPLRDPQSDLTPWGLWGNLCGSTTWNMTVMEKQWGTSTTSMWILADQGHTHTAQAVIPTSGFDHLEKKGSVHSDQGTWQGLDLPDSDLQQGVCHSFFPACPRLGKVLKHSSTHCGECLLAPPDREGWWQLLEALWARDAPT